MEFMIADTDCHTSELWTMLVNHVMETLTIGDIDSCYRTCAAKPGCQSINYYRDKSLCELNSWTIENTPHMRVANKDSVYFTIPVDGNLTEWGRWSNCSLTCGKGTRYRNRSCTYPPPAYGGKNCTGPYNDTQSCNPQPCFGAIGIQNKTIISDYYLTATRNNGNANKASLNGRSGWWANCEHQRTCNRDWLQINLGKIAKIIGIATQGGSYYIGYDYWSWTEKYRLSYSNESIFTFYKNGQVLKGNTDRNTIVYHNLAPAITARYVRIHPMKDNDKSGAIALRMELYESKEDEG
ncbi:coadhesin [Exaiptasia diaphana]|uniref:F5/8 type C domain-containing protein n=1 Tax=Exaiptasia diaphana TaxID=2652724 RepID=A0A913YZP2_EXADI|nr:coadhesin [Exaiptasia diaphana]